MIDIIDFIKNDLFYIKWEWLRSFPIFACNSSTEHHFLWKVHLYHLLWKHTPVSLLALTFEFKMSINSGTGACKQSEDTL